MERQLLTLKIKLSLFDVTFALRLMALLVRASLTPDRQRD
jgi:hypothetical protein